MLHICNGRDLNGGWNCTTRWFGRFRVEPPMDFLICMRRYPLIVYHYEIFFSSLHMEFRFLFDEIKIYTLHSRWMDLKFRFFIQDGIQILHSRCNSDFCFLSKHQRPLKGQKSFPDHHIRGNIFAGKDVARGASRWINGPGPRINGSWDEPLRINELAPKIKSRGYPPGIPRVLAAF